MVEYPSIVIPEAHSDTALADSAFEVHSNTVLYPGRRAATSSTQCDSMVAVSAPSRYVDTADAVHPAWLSIDTGSGESTQKRRRQTNSSAMCGDIHGPVRALMRTKYLTKLDSQSDTMTGDDSIGAATLCGEPLLPPARQSVDKMACKRTRRVRVPKSGTVTPKRKRKSYVFTPKKLKSCTQ